MQILSGSPEVSNKEYWNKNGIFTLLDMFAKDIGGIINDRKNITIKSQTGFVSSFIFNNKVYNFTTNHPNLPLYYLIGRDKIVALRRQIKSREEVLVLKNASEEIVPEVINTSGKNALYVPYLSFSGTYNLQPKKLRDTIFQHISFNYNRSESKLNYFKSSELESEFAAHNIQYLNAVSSQAEKAIAETQLRNSLWKWFVFLALLFLAFEILLIKYYRPGHSLTTAQV